MVLIFGVLLCTTEIFLCVLFDLNDVTDWLLILDSRLLSCV